MFTLTQIKTAHAKVKSGADFPSYINELSTLGITQYVHFVADGCIEYCGANNFSIASNAKWDVIAIAKVASKELLQHALTIHQQGQTDYLTFCKQSGEAGVEKWIVDITAMTCTYYDLNQNEMITEVIPSV
jgi:uncharacterized protein YbcV (DUF1398 family)